MLAEKRPIRYTLFVYVDCCFLLNVAVKYPTVQEIIIKIRKVLNLVATMLSIRRIAIFNIHLHHRNCTVSKINFLVILGEREDD